MKPAKILYFVDGHAPSPDDFKKAAELAANVVFRNARAVPSEPHSLEICDGVTGKVPVIYAKKYKTAEEAIEMRKQELAALSSKVGDAPAPKPKQKSKQVESKPNAQTEPKAPVTNSTPNWNPNPPQ